MNLDFSYARVPTLNRPPRGSRVTSSPKGTAPKGRQVGEGGNGGFYKHQSRQFVPSREIGKDVSDSSWWYDVAIGSSVSSFRSVFWGASILETPSIRSSSSRRHNRPRNSAGRFTRRNLRLKTTTRSTKLWTWSGEGRDETYTVDTHPFGDVQTSRKIWEHSVRREHHLSE